MPRRRQPPRLYLREDEQVWLIRDGTKSVRTGCSAADREAAERALADYLARKFTPAVRERDPDRLSVAEVLTAYGREHAPHKASRETIGYAIEALLSWWGSRSIAEVNGPNCRAYAAARQRSAGLIRRELGVLGAAINFWHKNHGPLIAVPAVTLPDAPSGRQRWLTRSEAARLLAGALGWYQVRWSDLSTKREHTGWRRDHDRIQRHAARFILLGIYTGTRSGAMLAIQWLPNTAGGWVDLDRGVIHRRGQGEVESKKRKPPARLGKRILTHLRRWARIDADRRDPAVALFLHVVNYEGRAIRKERRAFASAVELAQLDDVSPHVLRHTRATWLMQAGVDLWEAAGSLGMSPRILQDTYSHHHPDFQQKAAEV